MKIRAVQDDYVREPRPIYSIPNQWFLHGELEDKYGDDKADIVELTRDEENSVFKFQEGMEPLLGTQNDFLPVIGGLWLLEGVYDVEIENDPRPAVGFFWYIQKPGFLFQRGLVVYEDDEEAYQYANTMYQDKSYCL